MKNDFHVYATINAEFLDQPSVILDKELSYSETVEYLDVMLSALDVVNIDQSNDNSLIFTANLGYAQYVCKIANIGNIMDMSDIVEVFTAYLVDIINMMVNESYDSMTYGEHYYIDMIEDSLDYTYDFWVNVENTLLAIDTDKRNYASLLVQKFAIDDIIDVMRSNILEYLNTSTHNIYASPIDSVYSVLVNELEETYTIDKFTRKTLAYLCDMLGNNSDLYNISCEDNIVSGIVSYSDVIAFTLDYRKLYYNVKNSLA